MSFVLFSFLCFSVSFFLICPLVNIKDKVWKGHIHMSKRERTRSTTGPHSEQFQRRQEGALLRKGLSNATASSRVAVDIAQWRDDSDEDVNESGSDCKSIGTRTTYSTAPSLHPSVRSAYSMGCSETTIGAGDNTSYWDFQHRAATMKDLGHTCRECKEKFTRIGEPLTERRGARTSLRYHAECFSGFADPRSQASSSAHIGALAGTQLKAAPLHKAGSKMRTGSHFTSMSDRHQEGQNKKITALMGGSASGFGAQSSKGKKSVVVQGATSHGGLSVSQLAEHNRLLTEGAHPTDR